MQPTLPHTLSPNLPSTVLEYFAGERHEMLIILACSALFVLLSVALWAATRSGFGANFATGFLLSVSLSALMLSAMAVSLLTRDKTLSANITAQLHAQGSAAAQAVKAEQARMEVVAGAYKTYRMIAGAVGLFALLALVFTNRTWLHGVAAGLLLLVVAQVLIDHYSEARARGYLEQLGLAAKI